MKKLKIFIFAMAFAALFLNAVWAADYAADQQIGGLSSHGGSVSASTLIMIRDPVDANIVTSATAQEAVTAVLGTSYDSSAELAALFSGKQNVLAEGAFADGDKTALGTLIGAGAQNVSATGTPSFASVTATGASGIDVGVASTTLGLITLQNNATANAFSIFPGATGVGVGWRLPTAAPGGSNYLLNVDADGTMDYTNPAAFQAADDDLTTYAGITPSANVQSVLGAADYAAINTLLGSLSNPMTTAGDIIYGGASGTPTRLAESGTDGWVLHMNTATHAPYWAADATGAGGSAITFDIGDDGGNDSVDVNEIATNGDTNAIFSEPSADKIYIDLTKNWPTADAAVAAASQVITDNALLTIDQADAASGEYLRLTANGAESRSSTEVKTDLGLVIGTNVEAHDATLTDIADGTIAEDLVNTANPWADNEVANTLTVTAQNGSTWDLADSITVASVYSGTTSLEESTAANDSGAYLIGVYDEFDNSDATNVQGVLNDLDAAIAAAGNPTVTDSGDADATWYLMMADGPTGTQAMQSDSGVTLNPSTNVITAGGYATAPSSTPGMTFDDQDAAAGTGSIYFNSSGGAYDIVATFGVEDSGGENQGYIELDGVNETVDILKPCTMAGTLNVTGAITGDLTGSVSGSAGSVAVGNITGAGTGVLAALANNLNASGGVMSPDGTATLTNKTLDTAGTGNSITVPLNGLLDGAITDPADSDDMIYEKIQYATTITDVFCLAEGGGTITIDIQECSSTGGSCTSVDAAITCDADGAEDDGTLTNGSGDAGDWYKVVFGAPSGTVNNVSWVVRGTQTW
jgi:hypothetical protein